MDYENSNVNVHFANEKQYKHAAIFFFFFSSKYYKIFCIYRPIISNRKKKLGW